MIRESVKHLAILAAAAYGILLLVLFLRQDSLIYYPNMPSREYDGTPDQYGMRYEEIALTAADGIRLAGWFVPADKPRGVLLYAHGNAGNISHRLDAIRLFHDLGLSVLIFDYRGYGKSNGIPSEAGLYRDAEAAWTYLTERRGIPPARIVLFGESLGGSVAAHLAAQHRAGALILASAFTSAPDLASDLYPWLPVRWLTRFDYPTRDFLQNVDAPILIAHSPDDEITPFHHGKSLYEAARGPRRFVELRGGHNDLFQTNGELLAREIDQFLRLNLAGDTSAN